MPDDLELRRLSRPELAALVVAGLRGGTDAQRARAEAAWALLAALDIDRVRGIVATFRFPEHEHVRIDEQDQRDMVQEAHTRDGLAAARARGPTGGQKPKLTVRQAKIAQAMYDELGLPPRRESWPCRAGASRASAAASGSWSSARVITCSTSIAATTPESVPSR